MVRGYSLNFNHNPAPAAPVRITYPPASASPAVPMEPGPVRPTGAACGMC